VRLHVAARLLQPIVDVLEGAAVGDVKEQEAAHRVTVVGPGDGPAQEEQPQQRLAFLSTHNNQMYIVKST